MRAISCARSGASPTYSLASRQGAHPFGRQESQDGRVGLRVGQSRGFGWLGAADPGVCPAWDGPYLWSLPAEVVPRQPDCGAGSLRAWSWRSPPALTSSISRRSVAEKAPSVARFLAKLCSFMDDQAIAGYGKAPAQQFLPDQKGLRQQEAAVGAVIPGYVPWRESGQCSPRRHGAGPPSSGPGYPRFRHRSDCA